MPRLADSTTTKISPKKDSRKIISSRINCGRSAQLDMLRCTAPRSPAHIETLFQLEIGEKWSTSLRLLLLIVLECVRRQVLYIKQYIVFVWYTENKRERDWRLKVWNTDLKRTERKQRLFGCYNHRELKYSYWKILLPDFVVKLHLFLEVLLYFFNLLFRKFLFSLLFGLYFI